MVQAFPPSCLGPLPADASVTATATANTLLVADHRPVLIAARWPRVSRHQAHAQGVAAVVAVGYVVPQRWRSRRRRLLILRTAVPTGRCKMAVQLSGLDSQHLSLKTCVSGDAWLLILNPTL